MTCSSSFLTQWQGPIMFQIPCGGTDPQILDVIHEAIALAASQGGTQQYY